MKTSKENQMRVGIFITLAITILCVSIFFLGGSDVIKSQMYFRARFPQVQGLQKGSVISFSGIVIGNIEKISLDPSENIIEVSLRVDARYASRFTEGTEVDIRTQGALGDKYIYIKPGAPNAKVLAGDSLLPNTKATDIISVFSEKGDQAAQIFDILNDIRKITAALAAENQVGRVVANTDTAVLQLKKTLEEGERALKELRGGAAAGEPSKLVQAISRLEHILAKLEKGEGTLGALLTDSSVHERLKALLGADNKTNNMRSLMRTSIEHQEKN